ncbi:hypothetical protein [Desulfosediminicola ganghwensis]|uniref:hypothetical protein n=1 Tax=Desulfosediminicola ganghwensis TaxID=2569540 RepID=UPI0010AB51EC|nr:hypothetical protein [Desulfosediminicola ganghwensis]
MNKNNSSFAYSIFYLAFCIIFVPFLAQARDFHKSPRDFLFGNHLDTHQETRLTLARDGSPESLSGLLYIIFTEEIDTVSGLPIARHPRGAAQGEDCNEDAIDCVVGWQIDGLPAVAKFLFSTGINGEDHPVWLVNRADIVQPGSFTHFHWIGQDSTDPGSVTVPNECDADTARELEDSAEDKYCPGWFLEIKALREFVFDHGGEKVVVRPGIDNTTHLNLVTNYDEVPGITRSR